MSVLLSSFCGPNPYALCLLGLYAFPSLIAFFVRSQLVEFFLLDEDARKLIGGCFNHRGAVLLAFHPVPCVGLCNADINDSFRGTWIRIQGTEKEGDP